jgi:hypothetical protein
MRHTPLAPTIHFHRERHFTLAFAIGTFVAVVYWW